jgi:hypothetical protein
MKKSKLGMFISNLSVKEQKSFTTFLSSPYHNVKVDPLRLFTYIVDHHEALLASKNYKKLAHKALYPKQAYNDKKIRYLMSELLELGEQFLLMEQLDLKGVSATLTLMDEFTKKNLTKHYHQKHQQLERYFSSTEQTDVNFFLDKVRATDIEEKYYHQQRHRLIDENIQQGSDYLNRYFVLKKLKYACSMLNRQAVVNKDYDLGLPENWLKWLEDNDYWGEEVIKIFATVFLALQHPDNPAYFEVLNERILANKPGITLADLKELHLYAINHCARKMREGKNEYVEKALNIYLNGINTGVLLEDGYFSPWSFGNVVKLALRLEKYDWIERFMDGYKHYLPPGFRENTMSYNLAELYCYKKDFSKALSYLIQVEFSDLSYHLGSRIMLSKIYYELKEEKALSSLMGSFMMFLKRNKKISTPIKKTCLHFCDFLFLIIRGKLDGLEERIKNVSLLTDRSWLLEKLKERQLND